MLTNAPRGTKDILPEQVKNWVELENKIREMCKIYGYEEIRTPIFEHTELFQRGIGEGTDVVDKEMYTFTDRGDRSITLRPENTASVVRAYLQNKLYANGGLVKLFYIGSMFRYDRPQAGRLREFHQFGVEALGEKNPAVDAEIILLAWDFLKNLGLEDLKLKINTVGCPKCRPIYRQKLREYFFEYKNELCEDCQRRIEKNPLRLLDCKIDGGKDFVEDAPKIETCLCDECREHFDLVKKFLQSANVDFEVDSRLVRGLDYYTKTAFEIQYTPLGAQAAVAGGGRYDGLVEEIGGNPTPGIGFAMGMERLLIALEKQNLLKSAENKVEVFIVASGADAEIYAFEILTDLRRKNISATMDFAKRTMKAQMKQAAKSGAKFALIIGDDEVISKTVTIKNLETSAQEKISLQDLPKKICREEKI
ncbi:MAG: histidine--tRNA ligase [Selenomonadaceae bacterium]|nr:histidine--tRNA ligase [Selenomonadaceae bacterium]